MLSMIVGTFITKIHHPANGVLSQYEMDGATLFQDHTVTKVTG
jgi:hypothetical protein